MLTKIEKAGIIGAGGAGFPTHFKLGAQAEYYVINAAECEPLLLSDRTLMNNYAREIIDGIKIVKELTGIKKAYIGIKEKNADCAENLKKYIDVDFIEVRLLKNIYPSGDEQVMIYEILGRIVPEGGIPLNIGVIVNNVETVYRISRSVRNDEPFTRRHVSVLGEVKNPSVIEMPIGVSFEYILESAGKIAGVDYIAIDGGPMMGQVKEIKDSYVNKTTSGIIFLDKNHPLILKKTQSIKNILAQARSVCCNCMTCTDLCSRYLLGHRMEPHKIMRASCSENFDEKLFEFANLCSECNICELYACPVGLSPRSVNKFIKDKFRKEGKRITFEKEKYIAPDFRDGRQINTNRIINRLDVKKYYLKNLDYNRDFLFKGIARISLSAHIGAPAKPIVNVGETVNVGTLIGEKNGNISANVHSSFDGKIKSVNERYIEIEVNV